MIAPFWRASVCVLACLTITAIKAEAGGCDSPRFSEDVAGLYKAASDVSANAASDAAILCDEESYVFDTEGKAVRTRYLVYKVLSQRGAEGWDALAVEWQPWNNDKPIIRARVITRDNAVHVLDAKTVSDGPAGEESQKLYSDRRVLRAPLPAIAPGSVVEEEEITNERAPLFGAGVVSVNYLGRTAPMQQARLVLDAPAELSLQYRALLLPELKPRRSESNGRIRLTFEQGPIEALENVENYLPSDSPGYPQIVFATGRSWQSVAESYGRVVDKQIDAKDVEPLVKKLVAGKVSREEKASAILQFLSSEVRYTGVEFGDSAIVPHMPAETLKHKYGDCKDKSTLLVAMLRAAGMPAYVAVLNAGRRQEVEKELPGLGMFDHAIVYAPGTPDFWIDATDEYARLGEIPRADQGRLTLVARESSKELLRIPEASPGENLILESREFHLAEHGPARIIERTEARGVYESEYRSLYADEANNETTKSLTEYVKSQYLAEKLSRMERSDPGDLSKQFRLTVEADAAKRGFTDLETAVVAIRLESLFQRLPSELKERESDSEKSTKARLADYQLPEAFVTEWHYRIFPPPSFQLKPLPANRKVALGPAAFSEEFRSEKDGSVEAVIRFDTVKRRFTAAEAAEMRTKIAGIREEEAMLIYFEPVSQALLSQGKIREASRVIGDLIAQHPKEAVHHLRKAKVLLAAGMGQAARDEARLAVKLEPNSALAQKTLAEVLTFDLVGRQYERGSDYPGAQAAYREAKRLDGDDKYITESLALLLEHNDEGERYGRGANLKDATAEYRSLSTDDLNSSGLKNNPAFTLFYAGEFGEAKKYGESVNPQLTGVIVAAETAMNGTQAGISEARRRTEGEANLKTVLKTSGEMLMRARKYGVAADLMEAGASGSNASNTMALAGMLRKAQPHREEQFKDDPAGLIEKFFALMCDAQLTPDAMRSLASRNALQVMRTSDPEEMKKALLAGRQLRSMFSRTGLPADVMVDVAIEAVQVQKVGDDTSGYRVTMQAPGSNNMIMYVVKEDGKYKILDSSEKPNAVALEIMDRLRAQNKEGARILLDWVREDQHVAGGDDPIAGFAFPRMWTKGTEADLERMKVVTAALLAETKETAGAGVPVLETARSMAQGAAEKLNLGIALLDGYRNLDQYEKLLKLAVELRVEYPDSKRLFWDQEAALNVLRRFAEADALSEELLKRVPDDLDAMRALRRSATMREDYVLEHARAKKIAEAGKAEAQDLNEIAWSALFTGKVEQADLDTAIKSTQMGQNNPGALHTLGCVYAELGKTKEAREVLIQAMDQLGLDEPDANYWYAFGRIAEQYGEREVALQDYKNVEKPTKATQIPSSSYRLAQERLKALQSVSSD
jgi:transglutaminase-like putative cysteine protease/tetratricopeptide (TPR) repeat protein